MTNTVKRHSPPGAKRCAFTGYRPQKMPFGFNESDPRCIDFKRRVKETIQTLYGMGYRHFISGGAQHDWLFAQADITTATGHTYTRSAMFRRNHYLVDNADLLLAAYDGQSGGTAMTCELARCVCHALGLHIARRQAPVQRPQRNRRGKGNLQRRHDPEPLPDSRHLLFRMGASRKGQDQVRHRAAE